MIKYLLPLFITLAYADTPCEDTAAEIEPLIHAPKDVQYYPPSKERDSSLFLFESSSSKTDDHHDLNTVKISTKPGGVKGSATVSTVTDPWADVKSERPEKSVKVKIELEHKF